MNIILHIASYRLRTVLKNGQASYVKSTALSKKQCTILLRGEFAKKMYLQVGKRRPIGIRAPSPSVRYDVLWAADWQAGIRKHTHRQAIDTHTIGMSSILLHTVPATAK